MPIYEYECRSCGERFEVVQRMSEGNEGVSCPKCNADRPERLLSAFCSSSARTSTSAGPAASTGRG